MLRLCLSTFVLSLLLVGCAGPETECQSGLSRACTCNDGTPAKQSCSKSGEWLSCQCGNNQACTDGAKRACPKPDWNTKWKGACTRGFQICEKGVWGECQGTVKPQKETCDGKDNDCDGLLDEGGVCGRMGPMNCRFRENPAKNHKDDCGKRTDCICAIDSKGQVWVCFGYDNETPTWQKEEDVTRLCHKETRANGQCGKMGAGCREKTGGGDYRWTTGRDSLFYTPYDPTKD